MKALTAAALVAAQILAAAPATAAELPDAPRAPGATRVAGFAGARLHIPLGARRGAEQPRLGLALAPLRRTAPESGEAKLRFGEGVEFGLVGHERPALRVAGYRMGPDGGLKGPDGRKLGVSTIGAVAIGATVVLVGAAAIALLFRSDED
jgi:hypothetical protein